MGALVVSLAELGFQEMLNSECLYLRGRSSGLLEIVTHTLTTSEPYS